MADARVGAIARPAPADAAVAKHEPPSLVGAALFQTVGRRFLSATDALNNNGDSADGRSPSIHLHKSLYERSVSDS